MLRCLESCEDARAGGFPALMVSGSVTSTSYTTGELLVSPTGGTASSMAMSEPMALRVEVSRFSCDVEDEGKFSV